MSHAYPLAKTGRAALKGASHAARSRAEADRLSDHLAVSALETEWLTVTDKELSKALKIAEDGPGQGFLQYYEDASGDLVLAVTYWKLKAVRAKKPDPEPAPKPANEDHTDDLYFKHRKPRRKPKPVDPNQLALFDPPPGDES